MHKDSEKSQEDVFASIDLGTNNCRLMIAKPAGNGFTIIDSFSRITRLGEGMVSDNRLSEKAIERTLEVLQKCALKIQKHGVSKSRYIATEACRRATNGEDFIKRVQREVGLDFEIISPAEESKLSISGCIPLVRANVKNLLVFDIGGGSSEVSISKITPEGNIILEGTTSIPMGVLTVSEGFTGNDISGRARDTITTKVNSALQLFDEEYNISNRLAEGNVQMIGTSGTVTSLGAFHLNLIRYNRSAVDGLVMTYKEVEDAKNKLEKMTNLERIAHPCIGPQRADLTLAGCAILQAIYEYWKLDEITVADRGLREGILVDLMRKNKGKNKE
ncbi:MAG: Ppx/GppA family phosphatase [Alphaproteobacteria bacterium]|nr:Ppx/GppA family phosphatase [Alphaproteobacteria bacterium]